MLKPMKNLDTETMAEIMKALGDKNRLHILSLLSSQELCVCEITALCHLSQSNVSQHLAKLRSVGLVKERRSAQWVYYSLNPDSFPMIEEIVKLIPEPTEDLMKIKQMKNDSICK